LRAATERVDFDIASPQSFTVSGGVTTPGGSRRAGVISEVKGIEVSNMCKSKSEPVPDSPKNS
jgi:hypothetical protein